MKLHWLMLVPLLALAGLMWRPSARVGPIAPGTPGVQLTPEELDAAYGGGLYSCAGPTCKYAGICSHTALSEWTFYYNNGHADCMLALGTCAHLMTSGGSTMVKCFARHYHNSGCTNPNGSTYAVSSQPFCS